MYQNADNKNIADMMAMNDRHRGLDRLKRKRATAIDIKYNRLARIVQSKRKPLDNKSCFIYISPTRRYSYYAHKKYSLTGFIFAARIISINRLDVGFSRQLVKSDCRVSIVLTRLDKYKHGQN